MLVQSELRTAEPLPEDCVVSTVREATGVVGFRPMRSKAGVSYWFQLADPERGGKLTSSQLLSQRSLADGWAIDLAANIESRGRKARRRETVLRSQQKMLERIASQCADAEIEFGAPTVCGRGEEKTLCIRGRLREGG